MPIDTLEVAPPEVKNSDADKEFYEEMVNTIKIWRGRPDRFNEKKKELIERNPERAQEIEIFFDFPEFCQINHDRENDIRWKKDEVETKFMSLTEWNFLVTNYLLHSRRDKEGLENFWEKLSILAENQMSKGRLKSIQRGLTGQSSIYQLLEKLGYNPSFATPEQDAFKGTDLICHFPKEIGIQTKVKKYLNEGIVRKNKVSYPAVKSGNKYFSEVRLGEIVHLKGSTENLSKMLDRSVEAYEISLPDSYFDPMTGEPTEECIKKFQGKLKTI